MKKEKVKRKKVKHNKRSWLGKLWQKVIFKTNTGATKVGRIDLKEKWY